MIMKYPDSDESVALPELPFFPENRLWKNAPMRWQIKLLRPYASHKYVPFHASTWTRGADIALEQSVHYVKTAVWPSDANVAC